MNMTWDYIAGYFDGEGHVGVHRPTERNRPHCSLAWFNTHRPSLDAMREFMQVGIVKPRKVQARYKPAFVLLIQSRRDLLAALPHLLEFCIVKQEELQVLAAALETAKDRTESWGTIAAAGVEEITRLYWEEGLNQQAIADRFGVTQSAVKNFIHRNNIPARTRSEAQQMANRHPERWPLRNIRLGETKRSQWADPEYRARQMERIRAGQPKRIAARKAARLAKQA
jgi:hypothetical protein